MNLVDLVTSQLTGDVLGKLAGLTGTNEAQTRSATNAAVPALLTAFSKLASTNSGASTLATSLGGLDLKTLGNLTGLLGGSQASGLGSIGGSLLSSLLGNNLGGLVGTIASFAGMQPGIMKTLLTYLAPIVLGTVANSFKGAKPDAAGLTRLFSEQQDNIKAALPRGLSLADFDTSSASPRRAEETRGVHRHEEEPASAFPSWLPLLLLPLLGLVGWALWPKPQPAPRAFVVNETVRREGPLVVDRTETVEMEGKKVVADVVEETIALAPGVADALKMGTDLTGLFGSLGKVLGGVTNEDSARAAIPQLTEFAPVLESLQKSTVALPEAGRSTIAEMVLKNMGSLQKVIDTVMAIPGVKEILGPTVTPMIETISKLGK
ncbi:MAG: DUF937 domain-containing protein [Planctomycetia bacterium]|nr:DUF937 domain-containing protein [Planctomycetia bacterium]